MVVFSEYQKSLLIGVDEELNEVFRFLPPDMDPEPDSFNSLITGIRIETCEKLYLAGYKRMYLYNISGIGPSKRILCISE